MPRLFLFLFSIGNFISLKIAPIFKPLFPFRLSRTSYEFPFFACDILLLLNDFNAIFLKSKLLFFLYFSGSLSDYPPSVN